ncbi:carbon-nitrogen hydrolase family protein [Dyadobacter sp. LHD-138]|uniref:carbon-nitrogen hydrolase family protein n=1 Tax=Dyadobacter sp. LHD-138 TaxID=3071413 RepID=UPI0027E04BBC|nr:carbon-nitrogen hydrolase family protein [Dyadobacter sp. LHD-138]MDQ6478161.1 carbon-nitrogen hydrolase family protein [Dyadobacter sp. LHD-138]
MTIAAAQTIPKRNNIPTNLADHIRLSNLAADHGAKLIVFPEMSITGYERELAKSLAFVPEDERLAALRALSQAKDIVILAGAPILLVTDLHIGMFVLRPGFPDMVYTKQFLHDGEEKYFTPGINTDLQFGLGNEIVSLAICADITNPIHPARASALDTSLYIASIFYTPSGIDEGLSDLQSYAKELSMNVLMSNFGGPSYDYLSAGESTFWTNSGELAGRFAGTGEGLLIMNKLDNTWEQKVLKIG